LNGDWFDNPSPSIFESVEQYLIDTLPAPLTINSQDPLMSSVSQPLSTVLLNRFGEQQTTRDRVEAFTRLQLFALLLAPAVTSVLPILIWGVPNGPDLASHLRFAQAFNESLSQGNFYPAWQHLSNGGYGDGSFRIYSPFIYYALSATKLLSADWMLSFKFLVIAMSAAGSFFAFYWLRGFASQSQALVGASLYCFAPFRINELYQSAMLSQFAGAAFFLVALGVIERLANEDMSRARMLRLQVLFGLAFGSLIITHVPLAMMAALTLPLYASLRFEKKIWLRRVFALAAAGAIGLCLSAFYWVNLVRELPLLKGTMIQPGHRFDYSGNFALSTASQDQNAWYLNLVFLATSALIIPAALLLTRGFRSREHNRSIPVILIAALFTLSMATPVSAPLWKVIPRLSAMEFPWRWLSASSILVSGLAGVSLPLLWQHLQHSNETDRVRSRQRFMLAAGAVVIAIVFSSAYPIRNALLMDRDSFAALLQTARTSPGLEEWLPRWTTLDGANRLATDQGPQVSVSGRSVSIQTWSPELRQFTIGDGDKAMAQIHTFFYPYWQLRTADGHVLNTSPDADGVLLADVPGGQQTIQMKFVHPPHQTLGNILSLAGVAVLAAMTLMTFRRKAITGPA
jgi:hypothetical protein